MKVLSSILLLWACALPVLANDSYWIEQNEALKESDATTPNSPPKEYFSLNTLNLQNDIILQIGHDLINQHYVVMPSPNVMKVEKLPGGRQRVYLQQYFPNLQPNILSSYNIRAEKLHYMYIKTYKVYDQNGNLIESLTIPPGIQYRPPQRYTLDVGSHVKVLSFVFGFTARTAWSDAGMSTDLKGIYRDLRDIDVDRDSALTIDVNKGAGMKATDVLTSRENSKLIKVLSEFQHIVAWGHIGKKEDLISKILDLKNFETVNIELSKGVEDLRKYPHIFGDPVDQKYISLVKKMSSEKLSEKDFASENSATAKLGITDLFSVEGGGSSKQQSRMKDMVKFDIEGDMYVPKSLHFVVRTSNSFDLIKTLVFQTYDHLEEAFYQIGTGVIVEEPKEEPKPTPIPTGVVYPVLTEGVSSSVPTTLFASFDFQCPSTGVVAGVKSWHFKTDRSFQFECRNLVHAGTQVNKVSCQNYGPMNGQGGKVSFQCPGNSFLAGETSTYLNQDRASSYTCCSLASPGGELKKKQCSWGGWLNGIKGPVNHSCPANMAADGVSSFWLSTDRRYNYSCCAYGVD